MTPCEKVKNISDCERISFGEDQVRPPIKQTPV